MMKNKLGGIGRLLLFCVLTSLLFSFSSFSKIEAATVKIAADPIRMAVGARFLGMGKTGVSLLDESSSMYLNPAGIGTLKDWQITSMAGKFVGEIDYLQFTGVYPTEYGNFGLGYVGSGVGADFPEAEWIPVGDGEYRVIPSPTFEATYTFNNSVILLSYGVEPMRFLAWDWLNNITLGTNLKIFTVSLTGTGISGGTASGFDMDVGLLYTPLKWLSLGISGQNVIPYDMGGKLTWPTGQEEAFPHLARVGANAKVLGPDAPWQYGVHELEIGLDTNFSFTRTELPMLFHLGAEWWPTEYTALRVGVDQDYVGRGDGGLESFNNLSAGVGLLYSGFRFDYAYHQYNNIPENDTHYFSIAYNIWKEKPVPPPAVYIRILEPKDKTIIYADKIDVVGEIVAPRVKSIKINGKNVAVAAGGVFGTTLPMTVGKNGIIVEALDEGGKVVDTQKIRILRLLSFRDVLRGYWAKDTIEKIATVGIVTGYPDGTFRPEGGITRAEMTTLLVRAKGVPTPAPTGDVFIDLPTTHWAAKYVEAGSKAKLVLGYPDGTFRPSAGITRAEGIVVIARFEGLEEPEKIAIGPFPDVPGRHWAAKLITMAKSAGLLEHFLGKPLEPSKPLNRAESVDVLSRTKYAKDKIDYLMDWEKGYVFKK